MLRLAHELFAKVTELAPDVRFGQLICNLSFLAAGPWNETLWDVEDAALLEALRQHVDDLRARIPVRPST